MERYEGIDGMNLPEESGPPQTPVPSGTIDVKRLLTVISEIERDPFLGIATGINYQLLSYTVKEETFKIYFSLTVTGQEEPKLVDDKH